MFTNKLHNMANKNELVKTIDAIKAIQHQHTATVSLIKYLQLIIEMDAIIFRDQRVKENLDSHIIEVEKTLTK